MDDKKPSEDERQTVILIAFLINEMAMSDRFESLEEASAIQPRIIDSYARYSSAALRGIEKCRQRSPGEQEAAALISCMAGEMAASDSFIKRKLVKLSGSSSSIADAYERYSKAALRAFESYRKHIAK